MSNKKDKPAVNEASVQQTVTVSDTIVAIDPTSATLPDTGGTGSFTVTITDPGTSGTWTVLQDIPADWLTCTPTTPQAADGTVGYTATANPDPSPRLANIYVNLATFTLTQEASSAPPMYDVPAVAIDPASATLPDTGGVGSFTVKITAPGVSGTWIVDKDSTATWLTYTPSTPQAADGAVEYTAAPNPDPVPRTAHFYVNGKTFTVNQVELGGTLPIDPPPVEPDTVRLAGSGQELKEGLREKRRRERMAEKGY